MKTIKTKTEIRVQCISLSTVGVLHSDYPPPPKKNMKLWQIFPMGKYVWQVTTCGNPDNYSLLFYEVMVVKLPQETICQNVMEGSNFCASKINFKHIIILNRVTFHFYPMP